MFSLSLCLRTSANTTKSSTTSTILRSKNMTMNNRNNIKKKKSSPSSSVFSLLASIPSFPVSNSSNFFSPALPLDFNNNNNNNNKNKNNNNQAFYTKGTPSSIMNQISDRIASYPTLEELADRTMLNNNNNNNKNAAKILFGKSNNSEEVFDLFPSTSSSTATTTTSKQHQTSSKQINTYNFFTKSMMKEKSMKCFLQKSSSFPSCSLKPTQDFHRVCALLWDQLKDSDKRQWKKRATKEAVFEEFSESTSTTSTMFFNENYNRVQNLPIEERASTLQKMLFANNHSEKLLSSITTSSNQNEREEELQLQQQEQEQHPQQQVSPIKYLATTRHRKQHQQQQQQRHQNVNKQLLEMSAEQKSSSKKTFVLTEEEEVFSSATD